ncbi:MAG: hypothetical protein AAFN94_03450 [Pseudomonadota bacterium]
MRFFQMILLALGLAMVAAAGVGADYVMQKEKAQGAYDHRTYVSGLIDRVGNTGGILGLIFRNSTKIDLAMPDPPTGWEAWYIDENHERAVYSDEQWPVMTREASVVLDQMPELEFVSTTDQALYEAYLEDTSTAYTRGDNTLLLFVSDDNIPVNQPVLEKLNQLGTAHLDAISTKSDWRRINGQMWQEVEDPITRSENGLRPHRLRSFEAQFGSVTIYIDARASDDALMQFLEGFDLTGLQRLAATGSAAGTTAQTATPEDTPLRPKLRPAKL